MDLATQLKSSEGENTPNQSTPPKTPSPQPKKPELKINFREVLNWVIFLIVIITLVYLGYLVYQAYTYQPTSAVEEIKLSSDEKVIQRIESSTDPGKEVSTSESGYGRSDPFERY